MITLRDYQEDDVSRIRAAMRQHTQVLYVLPTGGGKTAVFTFITDGAIRKNKRVLIVVHRQELVMQTSLMLAKMGTKHKLITAKNVEKQTKQRLMSENKIFMLSPHAHVTIASVQTIIRRHVDYTAYDLLILDEAHHAVAGTWSQLNKSYTERNPKGKILGVTATPIRLDGKGLGKFFTAMVCGPSTFELIERGYLCQPRLFIGKPFTAPTDMKGYDYDPVALKKAMDGVNLVGDAVAEYAKVCPNVPALAFCMDVAHAEMVSAQFRAAGFRSNTISGRNTPSERADLLKKLAGNKIDVLTACDVVSEGTDVPLVGCVILLRKTKSLSIYLQQVGRALRRYPLTDDVMQQPHMQKLLNDNVHYAFVLDHCLNSDDHGMPQDERDWSLIDKEKKNLRHCDSCFGMWIAKPGINACPFCGHVKEPEKKKETDIGKVRKTVDMDGELVEVEYTKPVKKNWVDKVKETLTEDDIHELKAQSLEELESKAITLDDLKIIAAARGYKYGWVYHAGIRKGIISPEKNRTYY